MSDVNELRRRLVTELDSAVRVRVSLSNKDIDLKSLDSYISGIERCINIVDELQEESKCQTE